MKSAVLITGLLLIVGANLFMIYYAPRGYYRLEGFQNNAGNMGTNVNANAPANNAPANAPANNAYQVKEGFSSGLESAAGAKDSYRPIGQFDGVKLSTGNSVSEWRYTAPNEPLQGAEFTPDSDNLFMFKNNQCKPECCGASFSCGGGCVCTTPQQRQYIASRGGNRDRPEDSP